MKELICISCHIPMNKTGDAIIQRYKKQIKPKKVTYWECNVCGYKETVIGSGYYSIDLEPHLAVEEAKRKTTAYEIEPHDDFVEEVDAE